MITPTMNPQEVARDARQDMRALWNKVKGTCKQMEREHRKRRDKLVAIERGVEWRSPRGNNWMIMLRTIKQRSTVSPMVWYRGTDDRLRADFVSLLGEDSIHFSAHFLERYMERFDPTRDPIKRLGDFFSANHSLASMPVGEVVNDEQEAMVGLVHGLGVGFWNVSTHILTVTTFLDYGLLGENQLELAEALDMQRLLNSVNPGYRDHVLREAEALRKSAA